MSKHVGFEDEYVNPTTHWDYDIKEASNKRDVYDKIAAAAGKVEKGTAIAGGAAVIGGYISDLAQAAPEVATGFLIGGLAAGVIALGSLIVKKIARNAEKNQQNKIRALHITKTMSNLGNGR